MAGAPVSPSGVERLIRLYTPDLSLRADETVRLEGDRHHYLGRVLRARTGMDVELFNGDGSVFHALVTGIDKQGTDLHIQTRQEGLAPSPVRITLLQARLRGGRTETVIQKATELGVADIRLVDTARCQGRWDPRDGRKLERLQTVVTEASEQCGRSEVPSVSPPVPLPEALAEAPGVGLLLWEEARLESGLGALLKDKSLPSEVALLSGPEGGLSQEEAALATQKGFRTIGLGPRILRAETAPLTALSLIQFALGDLAD